MTRPVAVGVGGRGGWDALAWAGEHASQTGAALLVLHVHAPRSPLALFSGRPSAAQVATADPALARAIAALREKLGADKVSLSVLGGDPGTALARSSHGAGLLVIGAGRGGSTVRRVIRHATCPVVVARPTHADRESPFAGQVVVGVDGNPAGRAALAFALAYAEQRGLPACVVNVAAQGDGPAANVARSADLTAAMALMNTETAPGQHDHPRVALRRAVLHGDVIDALIWAADSAHLLVVGDRRRGPVGRARTGDVPLSVAHRAGCPVVLVPGEGSPGSTVLSAVSG